MSAARESPAAPGTGRSGQAYSSSDPRLLVPLEILHLALVFLGRRAASEGPEVAALPVFGSILRE
jgi:hypothetical protein